MTRFSCSVIIRLKPEILDPAGEATVKVLSHLGYQIDSLRIGRYIALEVEADSREEAREQVEKMASELLANPVMETYEVEVKPS